VGEDGPTAQMIVDLAYTRAIPNMTVLQPADWEEAFQATRALMDHEGPVYMRLGRGKVKGLYDSNYKFQIGKGHTLKQGKDLVIFATGAMVQESLKALESITDLDITVVNISSLKPLDTDLIIEQVKKNGAVITAEDHNRIGGLGDAVAEFLMENGLNVPFKKVAVKDTFAETGSAEQLYEKYGLSATHIIEAIRATAAKKK
jgi:transketolase